MTTPNMPPLKPLPAGHVLIGITGAAGAGKDTAANRLCHHHSFERDSFAEPLRDMLTALMVGHQIDYAHLFERELKEQPIPGLGADISGRRLMQTLGTEWGRNTLHPDIWVRLAALRLGLDRLPYTSPVHDRIVITDVRFPNEAEWINRMGGHVIRIERDTDPVAHHMSEWYYGDIKCIATLHNNAGIDWLHDQVDEIATTLIQARANNTSSGTTQEITP